MPWTTRCEADISSAGEWIWCATATAPKMLCRAAVAAAAGSPKGPSGRGRRFGLRTAQRARPTLRSPARGHIPAPTTTIHPAMKQEPEPTLVRVPITNPDARIVNPSAPRSSRPPDEPSARRAPPQSQARSAEAERERPLSARCASRGGALGMPAPTSKRGAAMARVRRAAPSHQEQRPEAHRRDAPNRDRTEACRRRAAPANGGVSRARR